MNKFPKYYTKVEVPKNRMNLIQSLEEQEGQFDESQSYHLARRLSMGVTQDLVDYLKDKNISTTVDALLGDGLDYLPENQHRLPDGYQDLNWLDSVEEDPLKAHIQIRGSIENIHHNRYSDFCKWWLNKMKQDDKNNLQERLTYFWHTHWAIEYAYDTRAFIPPPILYRSNQKLRKYRLGQFRDFVLEMSLDGAYLLYQGLNVSTKNAPNENYARELMELFTMGIGNYSEGDIREASRLLTGWRVTAHLQDPKPFKFFDTYFSPGQHDLGAKQILGETIPARPEEDNTIDKVREEEVRELINIIFRRRPEAVAKFIANKIYLHFVYSNPSAVDEEFIDSLADVFLENDFELLPVFRALFRSKHFYSPENWGVQIKSPIVLMVGLSKLLDADYGNIYNALIDQEQLPYDPPNVSGWSGYRTWISTKTYPQRVRHSRNFINQLDDDQWFNFIDKFNNPNNFESLNVQILKLTLPTGFTASRLQNIVIKAVNATRVNGGNWSGYYSSRSKNCADYCKELLKIIVGIPDFHLN